MLKTEHTYARVIRYLKGLLSNRERHELERDLMRDVFDEEAFDGLRHLSADELESDMALLMRNMDKRMVENKKRKLIPVYRLAAAIILILGIGSALVLVLRTPKPDLVTHQITREKQTPSPETRVPSVREPAFSKEEETNIETRPSLVQTEKSVELKESEVKDEMALPEPVAVEMYADAEATKAGEPVLSDLSVVLQPVPAAAAKATYDNSHGNHVTGRVLGVDGNAIPGVSIAEKGSDRIAVTDMGGNFTLEVEDTGSKLVISAIGYKLAELPVSEVTEQDITLTEDVMALNEVVVVGNGESKRDNATGAASKQMAREVSGPGVTSPGDFSKPLPPGGSMKAFEKWVDNQLHKDKFLKYPGKYRVRINLTVQADGTLNDVVVRNDIPLPIAEEYTRIISGSPRWEPALKDSKPIQSQVAITFLIEVK